MYVRKSQYFYVKLLVKVGLRSRQKWVGGFASGNWQLNTHAKRSIQ